MQALTDSLLSAIDIENFLDRQDLRKKEKFTLFGDHNGSLLRLGATGSQIYILKDALISRAWLYICICVDHTDIVAQQLLFQHCTKGSRHFTRLCKSVHPWGRVSEIQSVKEKDPCANWCMHVHAHENCSGTAHIHLAAAVCQAQYAVLSCS